MSVIVDYKGLQVASPDPTGAAGNFINENFKKIADELEPIGSGGIIPDAAIIVTVADINNPVELNAHFGLLVGDFLLAKQGAVWALYIWNTTGTVDGPRVVAGSSGFWVAIGGRHSSGGHTFGTSTGTGIITSDGVASFSNGYAINGQINSDGYGASASGYADNFGQINSDGNGSSASGHVTGVGSVITASGKGSQSTGSALVNGSITSSFYGAQASGMAVGITGIINAAGFGSLASGFAYHGSITAPSGAYGGAFAFGASGYGGLITATQLGSIAFGYAKDNGVMTSSFYGSIASGAVRNSGQITSSGRGSTASGYSTGVGSTIVSSSRGSSANGYASGGGDITASGNGSFAQGYVTTGTLLASGIGSLACGREVQATSDYAQAFGNNSKARLISSYATANGAFTTNGDAQYLRYLLRGQTLVANANAFVEITTPARFTIPNNTTCAVSVTISGRQTTGTNVAIYKRMLSISNNAGTTALDGTVQTIGTDIETDAAWDIQLTADNTNDSLKVEVKSNSQDVTWVATIEANEIAN